MYTTTGYSSNITISVNKNWHTVYEGNENVACAAALAISSFLMRRPDYTSQSDVEDVKDILGKTWSNLSKYITEYQEGNTIPSGITQWNFMIGSIELSLEKCLRLQNLILNHKAIIVLDNKDCLCDDEVPLIHHRITVEANESHQNTIVNARLMFLRTTQNYSKITLLAISQSAWNKILNTTETFKAVPKSNIETSVTRISNTQPRCNTIEDIAQTLALEVINFFDNWSPPTRSHWTNSKLDNLKRYGAGFHKPSDGIYYSAIGNRNRCDALETIINENDTYITIKDDEFNFDHRFNVVRPACIYQLNHQSGVLGKGEGQPLLTGPIYVLTISRSAIRALGIFKQKMEQEAQVEAQVEEQRRAERDRRFEQEASRECCTIL